MTTSVIWPSTLTPRTFTLTLVPDLRVVGAVFGGSEIVNDLEDDTWRVSMEVDSRSGAQGAALEALVNWLQGGIHTTEFGHFARPQPRGDVLTTTLATSAAKGADSVLMYTTPGQTIKIGDMFSVGGLLLQVADTVTATTTTTTTLFYESDTTLFYSSDTTRFYSRGVGTSLNALTEVKLVNRLRLAIAAGSAVNFNNPKIRWRMSNASGVSHTLGGTNSVSLEFVEDI